MFHSPSRVDRNSCPVTSCLCGVANKVIETCIKNGLNRQNVLCSIQVGLLDPNEVQGFPLRMKPKRCGFGNSMLAFGKFGSDAIEINGHAFKLRCLGFFI